MAVRIFRWKAIGVLVLVLAALGVLLLLFAEPIAREATEDAGSDLLGTEVDVARLDIHPRDVAVDLAGVALADPFAPERNLVEAARIGVDLDPYALAERKFVVRQLSIGGVAFGTRRERPARPPRRNGLAVQLVGAVRTWADQLDVPILSLTPIDTIRQLALDPTRLGTVQAATALVAQADSTRRAVEQGVQGLDLERTVDSARALVERLKAADPKTLGIQGTRDAIASVRRTLDEVQQARERVGALERQVRGGVDALGTGVERLDEARRRDYAFARSLLQLPSFDAPRIGKAFFGPVSIARFQQAMYWVQLARRYMPPGLLPRASTGPDRLRMAGATVRFPKERTYPKFLLEAGTVDFSIRGDGPLGGRYTAWARGVTSAPALYGRPTVIAASRRAEGAALRAVDASAVLDHLRRPPRDSITAVLDGLGLPTIDLPGLPVRVEPGKGRSRLMFVLSGDDLSARWSIASDQVRWAIDTAGRPLNGMERLVWRVISGLRDLSVTAELTGTVASPRLSVASNLDDAVASRLQAVVGEEVARAEQLARATVDSVVADKAAVARRRAEDVAAQARERIAEARQRLDEAQRQLEEELRRLTRGAGDLIPIPRVTPPW
ncbi:MAG TPA: hypothetical protein VFK09_09255 [Gemmatimonadales bacterium]|nr:hypothetical protein [Gemmatimonadales bacterium]